MELIITLIGVIISIIIAKIIIARHFYKCTECGHRFKVKWYWGANLGPHDGNQRMMKCLKCKRPTWCKIDDNGNS